MDDRFKNCKLGNSFYECLKKVFSIRIMDEKVVAAIAATSDQNAGQTRQMVCAESPENVHENPGLHRQHNPVFKIH